MTSSTQTLSAFAVYTDTQCFCSIISNTNPTTGAVLGVSCREETLSFSILSSKWHRLREEGLAGQSCSVPSKSHIFRPTTQLHTRSFVFDHAAATAELLQSCPTLCDPIDGSPPGSPVPGILQARVLEWVAIAFSVFDHE